jgi:hypothetical protein
MEAWLSGWSMTVPAPTARDAHDSLHSDSLNGLNRKAAQESDNVPNRRVFNGFGNRRGTALSWIRESGALEVRALR